MLHLPSCPPRTRALLDALCMHDPTTTCSRLLQALYACRRPRRTHPSSSTWRSATQSSNPSHQQITTLMQHLRKHVPIRPKNNHGSTRQLLLILYEHATPRLDTFMLPSRTTHVQSKESQNNIPYSLFRVKNSMSTTPGHCRLDLSFLLLINARIMVFSDALFFPNKNSCLSYAANHHDDTYALDKINPQRRMGLKAYVSTRLSHVSASAHPARAAQATCAGPPDSHVCLV
jgi:hypothetical protein